MSVTDGANPVSGTVLCGSKNIFTVRPDRNGHEAPGMGAPDLECRIKGKILKEAEGFYNPLAPGDRVIVEPDSLHPGTGMIIRHSNRKNCFCRFNQKGSLPQILAANVDLVLCMTTRQSPPFRPRFLDRILLQAEIAQIPALIICNKIDLDEAGSQNDDYLDAGERLEDFRRIGYEALEISAKTGIGMNELKRRITGKYSVLLGQSGVGKSSLINALMPQFYRRTGAMNVKYDRGNHTTTMANAVQVIDNDTWIIDTPGIRRFVPYGTDEQHVIMYMREFAPLAGKCTYGLSCSHRSEPGCKIMEAADAGVIHEDRYISFLRIKDELAGKNNAD